MEKLGSELISDVRFTSFLPDLVCSVFFRVRVMEVTHLSQECTVLNERDLRVHSVKICATECLKALNVAWKSDRQGWLMNFCVYI